MSDERLRASGNRSPCARTLHPRTRPSCGLPFVTSAQGPRVVNGEHRSATVEGAHASLRAESQPNLAREAAVRLTTRAHGPTCATLNPTITRTPHRRLWPGAYGTVRDSLAER